MWGWFTPSLDDCPFWLIAYLKVNWAVVEFVDVEFEVEELLAVVEDEFEVDWGIGTVICIVYLELLGDGFMSVRVTDTL